MANLMQRVLLPLSFGAMLFMQPAAAEAAWSFSVAEQNPAPVQFVMGTAVPVTYRVCNNSTNASETLRTVRFYLLNNNTTNLATAGSPAGWTCSRPSSLYISCAANTTADRMPAGSACSSYRDFTFNINNAVTLTQDSADQLSRVTARFSGSNTYRTTPSLTPNAWTWKSLQMTLVPSTYNLGKGCQFDLTMSVTNKMPATNIVAPNYVTSQAKPPLLTSLSGSATATTASVPANIVPLNVGASGSMVWTYTAGVNAGTFSFSAYARDSGALRTSSTVTTPAVTVDATSCTFLVTSLTVTPSCIMSGDTATITMVVSNTTGVTLANVDPPTASLVRGGTATIGAFTLTSGPTGSLTTGSTRTFIWTAPVTATPADAVGQDFFVTGNATSTTAGYLTTSALTSSTQTVKGYTITPLTPTNANSTNEELVWSITNSACASVNRVSITIPPGWPAPSDTYAAVDNGTAVVDTWTYGAPAFRTPLYPAADITNDLPLGRTGTYYLLFPSTPTTVGTSTFTTTITDTAGVSKIYNYTSEAVTVTPYDPQTPGSGNYTEPNTWREDVK